MHPMIGEYELILFDLAISIGVMTLFKMVFEGTGFVPGGPPLEFEIGIDSEGTHVHEPLESFVLNDGIQEIAGGHDGSLKAAREGFPPPRDEMIDDGNPFGSPGAVLSRKEIPLEDLTSVPGMSAQNGLEKRVIASGAHEATDLRKAQAQQGIHHPGPDKTAGACDQHWLGPIDDPTRFHAPIPHPEDPRG